MAMPKPTPLPVSPKKAAAKPPAAKRGPKVAAKAAPPKATPRSRAGKKPETSSSRGAAPRKAVAEARARRPVKRPALPLAQVESTAQEPLGPDPQSQVVAAKFARPAATPRPRPRLRPLPSSYGENHLLLLVRDPQTLYAAWDIAPAVVEGLKARIGRRGFAVSTLTLRLNSVGGHSTHYHLGKRTRSGYLRVSPGRSFTAEIGFTAPSGHFELVARGGPCYVPGGARTSGHGAGAGRARVRYREAAALVRRGVALARLIPVEGAFSHRPNLGNEAAGLAAPGPRSASVRLLGGASDLYRR